MDRVIRNLCIVCVLLPSVSSAQIIITEIMFDVEGSDTDREWVEVQNTGNEPVDLTQWKFYESSSNHGITTYQGGDVLAPGTYAVIVDSPAKFLADWPPFSGQVFDSSFALSNSGETLVLRCCGKDLSDRDSVTYNATGGGAGDGLSLHRNGSTITAAQPSPGNGTVTAPPPKVGHDATPPTPKTDPASTPIVQPVAEKTDVTQLEEKKQEPAATPVAQTNSISQPVLPEPTIVVQEEQPTTAKKSVSKKKPAPVVEEDSIEAEQPDEIVKDVTQPMQVAAVQSSSPAGDALTWWGGAAAISLLGATGAYMAGRRSRSEDGWEIEEVE